LLEEFLGIISGSSVVMADDNVPENSDVSTDANVSSRYTGNPCNSEGVTKSVAEGGLIAGAATATTGAVAGAFAGPGGALAGAVTGAAYGMIGGVVSGGVAHELGCN
jgi:phage-related minor tail protein